MKVITLILFQLVLFAQPLQGGELKSYSVAEVAKHNTIKSCWIIIDNLVYNVTEMIPHHDSIIQKQCGKDASVGFKTQGWTGGKHSEKALKIRKSKLIGKVKG